MGGTDHLSQHLHSHPNGSAKPFRAARFDNLRVSASLATVTSLVTSRRQRAASPVLYARLKE